MRRAIMSNAKSECEELLSAVMPFAEQMLQEHGEFFPFGASMDHDGEMAHAGGWTGEEQPESAEVIELLEQGFQEGAKNGEYEVTALVYDVRVAPPGNDIEDPSPSPSPEHRGGGLFDAIAVALDHRDDYSVVVYFPYSFDAGCELAIEAPFAGAGEGKIFGG
jgi:hypothetical protein